MDFTKPLKTRSVNGFPVTFRQISLSSKSAVWVPRGISRNPAGKCWRLYVIHENGLITANVYDDPSPIASLERAFELLVDYLKGVISRFEVDQRNRSPGIDRDPLIDTGFTGISLSRTIRQNKKRLVVSVAQMVRLSDGSIDTRSFYVGALKEESLEDDLLGQSQKFEKMLNQAVAVRRYYNHMRSLGVYAESAYKYRDVPAHIRKAPVDLPDLDIHAIMDSFVVVPRPLQPRTTGGDASALALRMEGLDLTVPQNSVWLENRCIKFFRREVEGRTLYLPTSVFRARGEWRVRVIHSNGVFTDSITDAGNEGSFLQSLREAWIYAIAMFREHPAKEDRAKPVKHPLLDTGVPSVVMQPMMRISSKTGIASWSFSLKVLQRMAPGQIKTLSVGYWQLRDVTDASLNEALRKASAIIAYREHLISQDASLQIVLITKEDPIPKEFWPTSPVCVITADDLKYYVEQRNTIADSPVELPTISHSF